MCRIARTGHGNCLPTLGQSPGSPCFDRSSAPGSLCPRSQIRVGIHEDPLQPQGFRHAECLGKLTNGRAVDEGALRRVVTGEDEGTLVHV